MFQADVLIRDTDKQYEGFISSNAPIRQANTQIVFDRTKSDMFKNSSGGTTQTVIGDGSANGFSFDSKVEDTARLQVFVNDRLIPRQVPLTAQQLLTIQLIQQMVS